MLENLLGICLTLLGAAAIALGMSVQTYGLQTDPLVPFLWTECSNGVVWTFGFMAYVIGNILFAVALTLAPFSLLGGLFITLVVWNLIFGAWLLEEDITLLKVLGAIVMMTGVILIAIASPSGIPTTYSVEEASSYIERTTGWLYITCLASLMLVCVFAIVLFEITKPLTVITWKNVKKLNFKPKLGESWKTSGESNDEEMQKLVTTGFKPESTISRYVQWLMRGRGIAVVPPSMADISKVISAPGLNEVSKKISIVHRMKYEANCPEWLNTLMGIVYPVSLGIDEALGHLAIKSVMALLDVSVLSNNWTVWIFNGMLLAWIVTSAATVIWLRKMLNRYNVTEVLPLEYGSLMICDVLTGLIYYREDMYMDSWQLIVTIAGVVIVVFGIVIGRLDADCCTIFSSRKFGI